MRALNPKTWIQAAARQFGYQLVKIRYTGDVPFDMDQEFKAIYERARPYTQTNIANVYSLFTAIKYVTKNNIPGDIVECGVWKGGSMMAAALTLTGLEASRDIWKHMGAI